jgi:hypothetical protein
VVLPGEIPELVEKVFSTSSASIFELLEVQKYL